MYMSVVSACCISLFNIYIYIFAFYCCLVNLTRHYPMGNALSRNKHGILYFTLSYMCLVNSLLALFYITHFCCCFIIYTFISTFKMSADVVQFYTCLFIYFTFLLILYCFMQPYHSISLFYSFSLIFHIYYYILLFCSFSDVLFFKFITSVHFSVDNPLFYSCH